MADGPGALGLDFLTQIVNVHWGGVDQQGLLAEYPPGPGAPFESIQEVMKGIPTAHALDSDQSFTGVNMGASGLGHTVLTRGLVCFGKPRNGDSCFMACPGFKYADSSGDALKRGALNEDGELVWEATGGGTGKLVALTFALDAFFAVYVDFDTNSTSVAMFDGTTWSQTAAFPSSMPIKRAHGGAVAAVVKPNTDGPPLKTYVAAGDITQDDSNYRNFVLNLMWATSDSGTSWSSNSNDGMAVEPGTAFETLDNYACTVAGGAISNTDQVFVAAAAAKTIVPNPLEPTAPFVMLTAAAAFSADGGGWATIKMPGALPGALNQFSFGLAVTYVRSKDGQGYFLLSDHEIISSAGPGFRNSNLYKSTDGQSWSKIQTNSTWMATLSAIAKDLDATQIVTL